MADDTLFQINTGIKNCYFLILRHGNNIEVRMAGSSEWWYGLMVI